MPTAIGDYGSFTGPTDVGYAPTSYFPSGYTGPYRPDQMVPGGLVSIGHGAYAQAPISEAFTNAYLQFLSQWLGRGATPFGMSVMLPWGAATAPGQLTAPYSPELSQWLQFLTTGQGTAPGMQTLAEMAQSGMPISALPEWQAMVQAQQRNIAQQEAQLREQFAGMGNLASSPFGTAMTDFLTQTTLDQNALLAQLQTQALEAARQRQMAAGDLLAQMGFGAGELTQQLGQEAIDRAYQEFIRTRPEYNPLLSQMFAAAFTFPPIYSPGKGVGMGSEIAALALQALAALAG